MTKARRLGPRTLAALALLVAAPAAAASGVRDSTPAVSPDGRTVAFVGSGGASASLMLVGVNGGRPRTLARGVRAQYLSWSPDGRSLAYSRGGIWRIDVADGVPRLLTAADDGIWQPAWSPDGRTIAYSQFERCFRCTGIWVMGADGSQPRRVVEEGRRPAWSPDGQSLAVSLGLDKLVVGLNGSTLVGGAGAYPAWSPSGASLA